MPKSGAQQELRVALAIREADEGAARARAKAGFGAIRAGSLLQAAPERSAATEPRPDRP